MKKILVPLLFVVGLSSCELDETPYSSIFTDNFYKTAQDAEAAITSTYGTLSSLYGGPAALMASDFSADQIYPRPVVARNTYTLFTYDPEYSAAKSFSRDNESPLQIWRSYSGIEKANWVIEKVPAVPMDAKRRDEIIGEAYFLRAFYHWMLTKNFGDIVVKTTASSDLEKATVGNSPQKEVYKQIYADLDQAVAKLPSYSASLVKGRASKEVALALYAKAALYNEDWATALEKAQAVISSGKYGLMADVRDVYNVAKEDAARQENMWAFECENFTPGMTSQLGSLYGPANSAGPEYGRSSFGSAFAYQSFFDSFDPKDKRRQLLDTTYVNQAGKVVRQREITPITTKGVLVKKYQDANSVGGNYAVNIPIFRLADVYLIAAEAEARATGATPAAYGFINVVRKRAGLADLTPGLSKEAFLNAVLQERSWELFAEGDRWYDLTRTNTFMTVVPKAVNDVFPTRTPQAKHRYFPIPRDEINANPQIKQNPGW
ncbi:RagB/SusD family nutrient uptake outer membrane protein [Larkinella soli]|uniref:RagB/SusD family nutrient uptake outer membrane protein n=1 Tax=Larkinella soli TaxID=1770527 RepID=UPI000FFC98B1|nr:RagB/SusD family nutrient uptake outer membrane protein [Larkinella soli]